MQLIEKLDFEAVLPALGGSERALCSLERATGNVGRTHRYQDGKEIRAHQRRLPADVTAPVVTDERRLRLAQRLKDAAQVSNQVEQCVCPLRSWLVRLPLAAHIERDDAGASRS